MIVVDASVEMKWLIEEEFSERADALLAEVSAAGQFVSAPQLLRFEVTNALRQRMFR